MIDRFRLSSTLGKKLERQGLSPTAVLRQAKLPVRLFEESKAFLTTEELFALYSAIHELSNEPGMGLKLGSEERIERYDPIAIAALCARTFRDSLSRMARYKRLVCPEELRIVEKGKECSVQFVWLLAEKEEPTTLIDLCFAWVVTIGRLGIGSGFKPLRIEFKRPEKNRRLYENHFGCSVKFGVRHNKMIFRRDDLDQPFLTHNPEILEMLGPQLDNELTRKFAEQSLDDQIKEILKRLLAGQKPRLEDVALELRVSTRTLQRRLLEERLTFQKLIEEARRELAQHYLMQSSLELNQTAYLLGYEDSNSFIRAFHKWEGMSPGEWRSARGAVVS